MSFTALSGGDLDLISNGAVNSLTSIGNTLYVGGVNDSTGAIVIKSYDSVNKTWTNLSGGDFVPGDDIYSLTSIGNTLYVAGYSDYTGGVIIKSYDIVNKIWTNLSGGDLGRISDGYVNTLTSIHGVLYAGGEIGRAHV